MAKSTGSRLGIVGQGVLDAVHKQVGNIKSATAGAKESAINLAKASPIGLKMSRNKDIKGFVNSNVHKEIREWSPMKKTTENIVARKRNLDKTTKAGLKSKGLY